MSCNIQKIVGLVLFLAPLAMMPRARGEASVERPVQLVEADAAAPKPSDEDKIALPERAWIASKLYAAIQLYFAHWQAVPDLKLDDVYQEYLRKALATDDRLSFDLASMEFMAQLRNGHSGFSDNWLFRNHGQPLGFFLSRMEGQWIVTATRVTGLEIGDVVQSIDGAPFDEFYARQSRYIAASGEIGRRQAFFYSPFLFPETFTLRLGDGRGVSIRRRTQTLKPAVPRELEGRMLEGSIGYLRIPSFGDPQNEERAVEFVKQNVSAKALIVDVRGNGGGSTPGRLIRALMDRPYRGWMESTDLSVALFGANRQITKLFPPERFSERMRGALDALGAFDRAHLVKPSPLQMPENPLYTGPLLVLTDSDTGSAAEDFVAPLKTSGRARVVGQTTYGSSGQPYLYDFGNGMSFRVSSKRQFLPDGSPFEGVGITPDVEVQPSLADLRAGTDVVLRKALELARAAANAPPAEKRP